MSRSISLAPINPFRVLVTHRNFRLFWVGQTLSLIGTWMQSMAQGWLALELSNSAFLVGLVSAIGSLPVLIFSLHAGAVVDRVDKLKLVIAMQSLMLVEATLLWWFTWSGHITIVWLLALAAANGLFSAFEIPARQALMVELVAREDLHDAIALNSSGFNLARILGPSIAAAVIAGAGLAWCFALNAGSYLAVLVGLFMIQLPARGAMTGRLFGRTGEGVREGLRYIRTTPEISALMKLVTVYSVLGIPYLTLMPVVARDLLKTGAAGYGVLLAFVGVGGLAGALFLAGVGQRFRRGRMLLLSSFSYAILLIAFSLARSVTVARPILLLAGFTMIVNSALANGALQSIVPDAFRGRLMAVYSFVVVGLSQVVGAFVAGSVARAVGVDWAIGGGAALILAYTTYAFWKHPEVREL
ncbi:MAG TPA: MFS transporter [Gemmatimonadaceae bacterium]|nr:MFS transporter [Gemmatimonadaceae bacterium]